jgi:hypothetical protein
MSAKPVDLGDKNAKGRLVMMTKRPETRIAGAASFYWR